MQSNVYFQRYANQEILIKSAPPPNLGMVITIPCFKETALIESMESIALCNKPDCSVEVIIIINDAVSTNDEIKKLNLRTYENTRNWIKSNTFEWIHYHVSYQKDLPAKHHGVGMARKFAMDEAAHRFEEVNNQRGIIVGFDADCKCRSDYLVEIEKHFQNHPDTPGASIYFEHLFNNSKRKINSGICQYELHLRYLIHAQRYAGFKNSFQTVGSSMAVRSDAYMKQGGMNRRQAGEDFYFINRIIALGNYTEIMKTVLYPSSRISDRVPFGTGKAMADWTSSDKKYMTTYNPFSFLDLKKLFAIIPKLYTTKNQETFNSLPASCIAFLDSIRFNETLREIRQNTASNTAFNRRLLTYLDPFRILKYLHFCRDNYYPNVPVVDAANWLLEKKLNGALNKTDNLRDLLELYRQIDQGSG